MDQKVEYIKAARWRNLVTECNRAVNEKGITKAGWCKENGVNTKSLYRWQKKFRSEIAEQLLCNQQEEYNAIVPLTMNQEVLREHPSTAISDMDTIHITKGDIDIRIPATVGTEYLAAIVRGIA